MRCCHILLRDNRDVNLPGTRGWYEEEMPSPFWTFGFPRHLVDCDVRCETLALAKRWRGIMFAPKWRGTGLGENE